MIVVILSTVRRRGHEHKKQLCSVHSLCQIRGYFEVNRIFESLCETWFIGH